MGYTRLKIGIHMEYKVLKVGIQGMHKKITLGCTNWYLQGQRNFPPP